MELVSRLDRHFIKRGEMFMTKEEINRRRIEIIRGKKSGDKLVLGNYKTISQHHDANEQMAKMNSRVVTFHGIKENSDRPRNFKFYIKEDKQEWHWYVDMLEIL